MRTSPPRSCSTPSTRAGCQLGLAARAQQLREPRLPGRRSTGRERFVVAKFYRPGRWSDAQILEEHAFVRELADAEIPVVAPLDHRRRSLHSHAGYRFALYPRARRPRAEPRRRGDARVARPLPRPHPRDRRAAGLRRAAGARRRQFRRRAARLPARARLAAARAEDVYAGVAQQAIDGDRALPGARRRRARAAPAWRHARGQHALDRRRHRRRHAGRPALRRLRRRAHGAGGAGPVDAVRRSRTARRAPQGAAEGYEDFAEFDDRELHLVEALRTLRLLHYSAWIARRWNDPAFPAAFPWFDTPRYWEDRILELREQIAAMSEPPIGA